MSTTLEQTVRRELERSRRLIEALRRHPARLVPPARLRYAETMADLDAAWERARDAVDALSQAVGLEASRFSAEFGDAWRLLKAELRRVQLR